MHGNSYALCPIREWQLEFRPRHVRGNKDLQLYCKWSIGQCAKEVSKVIIEKQRQCQHVITHHNICTEKIFWLPSPHLSILKNPLGFPCVGRAICARQSAAPAMAAMRPIWSQSQSGTQSGLVKAFGWPMTKWQRITCLKLIAHTRIIYIYVYVIRIVIYSHSSLFFQIHQEIYRAARRPASHGVAALHLWRFEAPQEPGVTAANKGQDKLHMAFSCIFTFGMGGNIPSFTCGFGDFLFRAGTRNRFQMQPLPDKLCRACRLGALGGGGGMTSWRAGETRVRPVHHGWLTLKHFPTCAWGPWCRCPGTYRMSEGQLSKDSLKRILGLGHINE